MTHRRLRLSLALFCRPKVYEQLPPLCCERSPRKCRFPIRAPNAGEAVLEAYRRVIWTASAFAVAAALMALTRLGNGPLERSRAN